jgi:hypothetical protein
MCDLGSELILTFTFFKAPDSIALRKRGMFAHDFKVTILMREVRSVRMHEQLSFHILLLE